MVARCRGGVGVGVGVGVGGWARSVGKVDKVTENGSVEVKEGGGHMTFLGVDELWVSCGHIVRVL